MITKHEITLKTGKTVVVPHIENPEEDLQFGWIRKTRNLSAEERQQELFFLVLESVLTDDEQDALDELSLEEFSEVFEKVNEEKK